MRKVPIKYDDIVIWLVVLSLGLTITLVAMILTMLTMRVLGLS